ncbi:MAG: helix-turn-helix domain-containing protein [Prevotellaceae bacterium]|nr:helix-turn-helix domain-containing protein [Prevotellaceae bacterium]
MDNIIVLHRDELSEIIHESVMNALRAFKEEENAPDSEFYTRKEVAAKWHVDEITVWRHEKLGDIHSVRRGRRVLYLKEEIDNYDYKAHSHNNTSL